MRARSIRSQLYLPVVRFGVVDTDWKFVIFITLACYSIPFLMNVRFLGFPLEIWTTVAGLAGSVAFFNFIRMGKRPFWLQHQIVAMTTPSRCRHPLPTDKQVRPWLLGDNNQ
jgi:hypothetical protein